MTVNHLPSGAHNKSIEFHTTVWVLDINSGDGQDQDTYNMYSANLWQLRT